MAAVESAQREVAGAEAGDGRDESNRTLQERLADAQNAQVWPVLQPAAQQLAGAAFRCAPMPIAVMNGNIVVMSATDTQA